MTDTATLPEPLVPKEADLRGYDFMPFYGAWLRASDFNATCTDAEYRAAVNLWWSSWHQSPPASLPEQRHRLVPCTLTSDAIVRAWMKVKKVAMQGFVLCTRRPVLPRVSVGSGKDSVGNTESGHRQGREKRCITQAQGRKEYPTKSIARNERVRNDLETLSKASQDCFDLESNKGREEKGITPPTPLGVPPVDNPAADGKRPRLGKRWRFDPNEASRVMRELGIPAGKGESMDSCVRRIEQELARRERDKAVPPHHHEPGHA
jgi:hypothetical protein